MKYFFQVIFSKNKILIFALILLFFLAFYLRAVNVLSRMRWDGDSARDLLVSKHLAFYDESLIVGHTASGAILLNDEDVDVGALHYPTYYFIYLSLLWNVFDSLDRIVFFNIFLHCLSLLGIFAIIYLITENKFVSLFIIAMFSVSEHFIDISQSIIGLQVSIPYVIFCGILVTLGWKKSNRIFFLIGLTGLTFLSTFNYALLVLIGSLISYQFLLFRKNLLFAFLAGTTQIVWFFVLHLPQINFFGFSAFIKSFLNSTSPHVVIELPFFSLLQQRVWSPLSIVFPYHLLIIVVFFLVVCFLFIYNRRYFFLKEQALFSFLVSTLLGYFILVVSKKGIFIGSYLYYANVLIFLLLGVGCGFLLKVKTQSRKFINFFVLVFLIIVLSSLTHKFHLDFYYESITGARNSYWSSKKLAENLLTEFNSPRNFAFNLGNFYDRTWENSTVFYWLEGLSEEKIYSLVNYSNNLEDFRLKEKLFIVSACVTHPDNQEFTDWSCQNADAWRKLQFGSYEEYKQETFEEKYLLKYYRKNIIEK